MTASLYRKYNEFSNCESAQTEQKHRTMTFSGFQTMYTSIDYGSTDYMYITKVEKQSINDQAVEECYNIKHT